MRMSVLTLYPLKVRAGLLLVVGLIYLIVCAGLFAEELKLPDEIDDTSATITNVAGQEVRPFATADSKASVLIFVTQDCPISNAYSPELGRLRDEYQKLGFKMTLVYVDPDVSDEDIKAHMKDYRLEGYAAIVDRKHQLVEAAGATITPEVAVVDPDGAIAYRGRIDNMYPYLGQRRRVVTERDLRNALDLISENKSVAVTRTQAVGCYVPNL